MTQKYFKERPSSNQIFKFEEAMKYLLQYLGADVKILLRDEPLRIESYMNSDHIDTTYHWIEGFQITTPEIEFVIEHLIRDGIDDANLNKDHLWNDAAQIQEEIYAKLDRQPRLPPNEKEPYWKLWDLR